MFLFEKLDAFEVTKPANALYHTSSIFWSFKRVLKLNLENSEQLQFYQSNSDQWRVWQIKLVYIWYPLDEKFRFSTWSMVGSKLIEVALSILGLIKMSCIFKTSKSAWWEWYGGFGAIQQCQKYLEIFWKFWDILEFPEYFWFFKVLL